mgnify:CR=1 FL=1
MLNTTDAAFIAIIEGRMFKASYMSYCLVQKCGCAPTAASASPPPPAEKCAAALQ